MKILIVGTGYVGLPHGAVCAEYGHEVHAYDIDERRINAYKSGDKAQIERQVNEPGLADSIAENLNRYLFFTTDVESVIEGVDVIFMCLNTPPQRDGSSDLSYLSSAARDVGRALAGRKEKKRVVIVNKSTVPVGTARMVEGVLRENGATNFGVASNPEFLAQGNAIEGSRRPDRIVVGADTEEDLNILRRVYAQFTNHVRIHYLETTPETAESIKYMANSLLLTYISYWNGVGGRLAESFDNIRMEDLKRGVTSDSRISTWGSYVSNGAGGSCFGKDIQSLMYQLNRAGQQTDLLRAVYNINEYQKHYLIDRAVHEADFSFNNKTVTLLGLAFKKRTNDMRDSAALKAVEALLAKGVKEIRAYDPLAMDPAKDYWFNPKDNYLFERITYHDSAAEALKGSDACYISTDWEEFRGLATTIEKATNVPYLVIDGRRMIFDNDALTNKGYDYLPVGGQLLRGTKEQVLKAEKGKKAKK